MRVSAISIFLSLFFFGFFDSFGQSCKTDFQFEVLDTNNSYSFVSFYRDTSVVKFQWDFGDGQKQNGSYKTGHQYSKNGLDNGYWLTKIIDIWGLLR